MDWDFVIVGSGFGGSVSALRLIEKGYRVLVLEKGRRYRPADFPRTNWNLRRWFWLPQLGLRGHFKMTFLPHLTALSGVGVGGGSLTYCNTLPVPKDEFFAAPSWGHLADWKRELSPHYDEAKRMLGVVRNEMIRDPELILRKLAEEDGRPERFQPTDVAVFFGDPDTTVPDPFFDGEGPERTGCSGCGACTVGCRDDGKNSLDKNYLHLADRQGLELIPDMEVTWVRPLDGGGFQLTARQGASVWARRTRTFTARNVVLAGGVLGTIPLLLKLKEREDGLPRLSDRVGHAVRTNSEALIGVTTRRRDIDLSTGVSIGGLLEAGEHSHLELVRYPAGSGAFRLTVVPHVPGRGILRRMLAMIWVLVRHPWMSLRTFLVPDWARYTTILLFMSTLEGTLRLKLGRSLGTLFRRGLVTSLESGDPPLASLPEATALAGRIAEQIDGMPVSLINETVLDVPTTAHVLGGCCMGTSAADGVIDHRHRVFGYDGLYVIDGSAISANPGVNPSLTITALAERAMSFVPEKDRTET
jgi:cholesterol oxidase